MRKIKDVLRLKLDAKMSHQPITILMAVKKPSFLGRSEGWLIKTKR
jgi:hypothetical protein